LVPLTSMTTLTMCITGTRWACINAAKLALADAGIPMRDIVTSCSAGYLCSTPLLGMAPKFFFHIYDKLRITQHKEILIVRICYFRSELYRRQCWRSWCHCSHSFKHGHSDSSSGEMTINSGCSRFESLPCPLLIYMHNSTHKFILMWHILYALCSLHTIIHSKRC
jgi:hypothetical protein